MMEFFEEDEPIEKIKEIRSRPTDLVTTCPTCGAGCQHNRIRWVNDSKVPDICTTTMGSISSKHPECADCGKVFELIMMNG